MTLKKLICLMLVLALALTALTGCRRGRQEAAPEATAEGNANPAGPGYTITDGTATQQRARRAGGADAPAARGDAP